ncbi:excinuclease ABC subunit C [Neptunomonas japonica]|uniref:Excinuclease ABC subunit C n=1 Tax=Neptunomonas japonica JAMM 1380 TaxID=1441457 RepID=A0A7R6PS15_9GAMM|nr:excinuclease ABC subunit C [Neptunomonas japonica]BBB29330.1 conserved hypothetical protein [Neptunomonas japonica JAMM 1380]
MSEVTNTEQRAQRRFPLLSDTNINTVLMNGAQIALCKLKRARNFDARLYFYAEIGAFLEVSLSRGAGISDDTRARLEAVHREATHIHMDATKASRAVED